QERQRLIDELRAGRRAAPRWRYAPRRHEDLRCALDAAEKELSQRAETGVHVLYLERVRELSLEAALCGAAGTRDVARLATNRFGCTSRVETSAARKLCATWLDETPPPAATGPLVESDAPDPLSLLWRLRAAVNRLRLPLRVVAAPALAPLAATGEETIFVACGRPLRDEDTLRTIVHEIEGHALPLARALDASSTLFRVGTARGVDDQEGRALLLEERAGLLGPRRRRQLAGRHRAVETMLAGASFADVASVLVKVHGMDEADAVVIAERAFRGGDGEHPGLGRERIYLESLVRVRAHLKAWPEDEHVMASGQVALEAIDVLKPFAPSRPLGSALADQRSISTEQAR
ncbi:MAG TPA: tyrosine/phenylalanine carboxypeptidase domain-containing protein, partial [Polyangiaceae bacterium]|nr:tyrosine/phenylalanine carboxypeptidase domain-containing protein [Polyangiaceae bacterium]